MTVQRKFSDFELIQLTIHQRPTLFITKAGIALNNVGCLSHVHLLSSVSHVNLLTNATSHWHQLCKITMANQEPHCTCPKMKLIPRVMVLLRPQAPANLSPTQKLAHEQFMFFVSFFTQSLGMLDISWGLL